MHNVSDTGLDSMYRGSEALKKLKDLQTHKQTYNSE